VVKHDSFCCFISLMAISWRKTIVFLLTSRVQCPTVYHGFIILKSNIRFNPQAKTRERMRE
jgi:hypothetical protein